MKGFDLHISLQEDCTFSEINATAGGHRGLDYIPGSALLGVAASHLYPTFTTDNTFELFHSGKVRFCNAYPGTKDGQPTYPVPLSCLADDKQSQQLRENYLSEDGQVVEPEKSFRMKTAIDDSVGRAKEAALFGYDSLNAGQDFYGQIQIDDSVSNQLVGQLKAVFEQAFYLGRSRSAEYGKANAQVSELTETDISVDSNSKTISLWLLSDMLILDDKGQPVLSPTTKDLGLAGLEENFLTKESHLRYRRYSTWNAYKHSPEMERQVITKGSVLVYELGAETLSNDDKKLIASGLGIERSSGLGKVWLNAPLLNQTIDNESFNPISADKHKDIETKPVPNPNTELIEWLEKNNNQRNSHADLSAQAKRDAQCYSQLLNSCREIRGLHHSTHVGPSQSQWGTAYSAAKKTGDIQQLLFQSENAACKVKAKGWKDEYWNTDQQKLVCFYDWFKEVTSNKSASYVQLLIRGIMSILREEVQK